MKIYSYRKLYSTANYTGKYYLHILINLQSSRISPHFFIYIHLKIAVIKDRRGYRLHQKKEQNKNSQIFFL